MLGVIVDTYMLVLLARVVMSWVQLDPYRNPVVRVLYSITEPVLAPIRSALPAVGGLDFSPVVVMVVLSIVKRTLG